MRQLPTARALHPCDSASSASSIPLPTVDPRGYARVKLAGRWHHLGKPGTPQAAARYDALLCAYLANGRELPTQPQAIAVTALSSLYLTHANSYYVKRGKPTMTYHHIVRALDLLNWAALASGPADCFTPPMLLQFARYLAADPARRWARKTINEYARQVKVMFKWAQAEGHITTDVYSPLCAVGGLRKGRAPGPNIMPPRESTPVLPVTAEHYAATIAHAPPMLRAMIELQALSGMRPAEVCAMRTSDLFATTHAAVTAYRVSAEYNKTEQHNIARTVYCGPKSMAILTPWLLPTDPGAYIFTARRARDMWLASVPTTRRRRDPATHVRLYNDCYTPDVYANAIERMCNRWARAQKIPSHQWRLYLWTPNQLRHNAATSMAQCESVEVAQAMLGHTDIATTMLYVAVPPSRAIAAAAAHL